MRLRNLRPQTIPWRQWAAALLLLAVALPAAARGDGPPQPQAFGPAQPDPGGAGASPAALAATLYEQVSVGGGAVSSQNYEPALDSFDSFGADDFTVTGPYPWHVTGIEVLGLYPPGSQTSVASVNVAFFTNNAGLPGTQIASATHAPSGDASGGNLLVNLAAPVELPSGGTFWVVVQANKDFGNGGGDWRWRENTVQHGNPSAWRNPGNGFNTGCTSWGARLATCNVGADPDLAFRVFGTVIYPLKTFLPLIRR